MGSPAHCQARVPGAHRCVEEWCQLAILSGIKK